VSTAASFLAFEEALSQSLKRHLTGPEGNVPEHLARSIEYSLLSAGKRVRPRMVLATAKMLGVPAAAAMSAAVALEMVHCFTLIHDDLPCMDNDDMRRGLPTNHKKFGEATALLAGDSLVALAIDVLLEARSTVGSDRTLQAIHSLSNAMGPRGVIGGQAQESTLTVSSGIEELRAMHAGKTGALFRASVMLPRDLAGMSSGSPESQLLETFAQQIGLSFQAADDLEDGAAESAPPTSILHYLSREQVLNQSLAGLRSATQALSANWKSSAEDLVRISEEVEKKLTIAGQGEAST
jgi:geranylgeranyl diphosphate synthase, type II